MLYIGLDIHSKWMTVVGFDPESGDTIKLDRVSNEREAVKVVFSELAQSGPLHGVMEAGTNSWAMYREILPYFDELVVADPGSLWDRKQDRKPKTDKVDCLRMATKLYRREIEPLYVPDEKTQDLRVLVRGKVRMSRWVTRLNNEISSLLRSWGYVGSRSLLSRSGKARFDEAELPVHSARVLKLYRELLEKAQEIEDELALAIEEESGKDEQCAILMTMPSVGAFTALLLRAEIGDVKRFPDADHFISYLGYVPKVMQSAERCYYGKLVKWGNRWMRYGIGLLAQRVASNSRDDTLHRVFWRVCLKKDRNSAKVAVARKAARIIYHMLLYSERWDSSKGMHEKVAA